LPTTPEVPVMPEVPTAVALPPTPSEPLAAVAAAGPRALRPAQYLWIAGAVVILALLIVFLGGVLVPFLVGAGLAYLGHPAVSWAERRGVPRTLGTLLVLIAILLMAAGLVLVLVPLVQSEVLDLARRLPDLAVQLYARVAPWLHDKLGIELQLDLATIKGLVTENLSSAEQVGLKVLSGLKAGGTVLLGVVINVAMIPVVMFYLLRDWGTLVARVDELLPRRWAPRVRTIAGDIDAVLAEFIRGQLSVMGVLAVYYAIGLSIAGLQHARPIGILTGLLVFIPYVGFGLGLILGMLAALLQWQGLPGFLAVLAVYGVGQLLENYVLVPWLVGDRIGLHPLAVIFALLAFGEILGFAGVLIALPASAALLVGLRHLRAEYVGTDLYR
jgi:predicted PurR-regulated permease PerM